MTKSGRDCHIDEISCYEHPLFFIYFLKEGMSTAHPLLSCILFKMRTISIEIKIPRHLLEIVSFILHSHSFFCTFAAC